MAQAHRAGRPQHAETHVEEPPDLLIQPDDILFVDLGPVFEAWEADFWPDLSAWRRPGEAPDQRQPGSRFPRDQAPLPERPGHDRGELYEAAREEARAAGWEFGGTIAGHLVGVYPHERIPEDKTTLYITRGNLLPLRSLGPDGLPRHWILEIHLVDRARRIGAFYEELLTIG